MGAKSDYGHQTAVGCYGSDLPGVDLESAFEGATHFVRIHENSLSQFYGGKISSRFPLREAAF